jgi:hypothetical protein
MVDRTTTPKIVNLADYRQRRAAEALPLLEALESEPAPPPAPADDRPLAPRQVAHRQRMLAHLSGAMLSECRY